MRILHCLRAPVGGLFRHVLDLASEQAARGHDVGILADSNTADRLTGPKFAAIESAMNLGVSRVPMGRQPGFGDFRAYRSVLEHARQLNLDVLHGHGAKGGAYARLAARSLKKEGQTARAFYTPHGGSLNFKPGTFESRLFLRIEGLLEGHTDGLIFESAFAARVYRQRVNATGAPERVIPNGLQPEDFAALPASPDGTDFLFIGELRPIKGIGYLLDALAALNAKRRVTATIVGSGPNDDELKQKSAALGLCEVVRFTGALPAREALRLGRIMVVPSLAESFPYVVLEAAAAGLPLISTSVGGIPEIVAGTDTQLVPPGDADALSTAMLDALINTHAAAARANRLRENVSSKFTVAGMTTGVLDFYALTLG